MNIALRNTVFLAKGILVLVATFIELPVEAQWATVLGRVLKSASYGESYSVVSGIVSNENVVIRDLWMPSLPAATAVPTNRAATAGELFHAQAYQDALGFSALTAGLTDDESAYHEKSTASVAFFMGVTNEGIAPIPMRMHMQIMPGRMQLRDETALGLPTSSTDQNVPRTSVLFTVEAIFVGVSDKKVWQWSREISGGRAGVTNKEYLLDPQRIGSPTITRAVAPDGTLISDTWDSFTATLDFGMLEPGSLFELHYDIDIKASSIDSPFAGPGTLGALVEAGDPFELYGGRPGAVGSGFIFVAGDLIIGTLKPLLISNVNRIGDAVRFTFDADPSRKYAVEFSDLLIPGTWSVLTNIPQGNVPVTHQVTDPVSPPHRFYRVRSY